VVGRGFHLTGLFILEVAAAAAVVAPAVAAPAVAVAAAAAVAAPAVAAALSNAGGARGSARGADGARRIQRAHLKYGWSIHINGRFRPDYMRYWNREMRKLSHSSRTCRTLTLSLTTGAGDVEGAC